MPFLTRNGLGVANIYSHSDFTWFLSDNQMFVLSDCL